MLVALLLCASCGGGEQTPPPGAASRVRIVPDAVLLTKVGGTARLVAQVLDAAGNAVSAPVAWRSTRGERIAVDADGLVTAKVANGSTQIVAEAQGVASPPLLALVTEVPPGTLLLTDAQIVGDPVAVDPAAAPSVRNTYRVTLAGVPAPTVGGLVVNSESKPVAGKVVSASPEGDRTTVTLKLVPPRELFPHLDISETFDLTRAELLINPELLGLYDVKQTGTTLTFTPKAAPAKASEGDGVRRASASNEVKLGPFTCEPALTGLNRLPILLTIPPALSFTQTFSLDLVYTDAHGLERLVLRGGLGASYDGSATVSVAFEGALPCELELGAIRIPIGGPASLLVGGLIPLKVGFELGGKLTVASASIGAKASVSVQSEDGIACPRGGPCRFVQSITGTAEAKPVFSMPNFGTDLRFEPRFSVFGKAELAIGNPFLKSLRFTAFEAQAGPKLEGSFALWRTQIEAADYASSYGLSLELRAGVGSDLGGALELLGVERLDVLELKHSLELGRSPVGTATADVPNFAVNDPVKVTVKLDPSKVDFLPGLGPYNVHEVVLVRRVAGLSEPETLARVPATSGQVDFSLSFKATRAGGADELYALLVTKLLPFDLFALEVGQATPPAGYQVNVPMPPQVPVNTPTQVTITVTRPDGQGGYVPAAGVVVELTASCGTVTPASATTSAQGTVTVTITANAGCSSVGLQVVVREQVGGPPVAQKSTSATVTTSNAPIDIDGNVYGTVTIGTQTWLRENLKVTRYRNGDAIGTTTADLSAEAAPKYQWAYDGKDSNVAIYGRLYTGYAATDARGICPTGWHVPTGAEWTVLTDHLGGSAVAGGKMKVAGTGLWTTPNAGASNSSGFTALPGGVRDLIRFGTMGLYGFWWSSTLGTGADAQYLMLTYLTAEATRAYTGLRYGHSVRCLKD
ncbi:MAG: hypothetical protein IT371_24610 [Deltaproteobacteria bacterium]|nr:hypothetical protein [Deltaproteobacteria bacterium]